jgi:protein TonB
VAIALSQNGEMRCRAVSGTIAPPPGARIDAHSGLTGACVSSGTLLRCNDTENDSRVDRDVCRALGIRAMVCVPVTAGKKVIGIFEIFSSRPQAFLTIDLAGLRSRAEEIARCFTGDQPAAKPTSPAVVTVAAATDTSRAAAVEVEWTPAPAWLGLQRQASRLSANAWGAVLGALVLLLGLFLLVRALRGPAPAETMSAAAQPVAAGAMSAEVPAQPVTADSTEAARVLHRPRPEPSRRPAQKPAAPAPPAPMAVVAEGIPQHAAATQPAPPNALIAAGGSSSMDLLVSSLPSPQPALAKPPRVSTGVAQPVLVHRVEPMYPAMAKQTGIQGAVVLDAVVDTTGKVAQVRVVKGNSLLAAAAVQAVRQWRYQPYQLNGEPIQVAVKITLNFELSK